MTREEAWNRIDAIIAKHEIDDDYVTITSLLDYDALRLARKLLEQEHCEDCVSRDALCKWINNKTFGDIVVASEHRFSELPPVQPKQRTGRWIVHYDDLFPAESYMECSECSDTEPLGISDKFCPNCGAKMQEVKE